MKNLVWTRIDDRLIHGQVMTAWIKNKHAEQVVIVDDATAGDEYMSEVLESAVPDDIAIGIFTREESVEFFSQGLGAPTLLLVKRPGALLYLVDHGIEIFEVDLGGIGASPTRSVLYKNISTSPDENKELKELLGRGVNVFVQVMPQDRPVNVAEYLISGLHHA